MDSVYSLLVIAHSKANTIRLGRGDYQDSDNDVGYHMQKMEEAGISWSIQNNTLMFVNNADDDEVWNVLHKATKDKLSKMLINGVSFNDILKSIK